MITSRRNFLTGAAAAATCAAAGPAVTTALPDLLPQLSPPGFLPADGRSISRTTYAELFRVFGTTYGTGDGITTFNLPNLPRHGLRVMIMAEPGAAPVCPVGSIMTFFPAGTG